MKKPLTLFLITLASLFSLNTYGVPQLSSLPSATATIFLDFDGHYVNSTAWNNGSPFACAPSGMTDAQITEVFNRTAEDYRPFNINITTDSVKFLAAPLTRRIRIIITPTSAWYPGVGGISYIGSFTWGDDTPGFVFCDKLPVGGPVIPKMVAECCTHESGHTVGLSHQSKYDPSCNLLETYSTGSGTGECAWSPIMGNSYYKNMTGWSNGPTPYGCTNLQDNLAIITSQNGFTYRPDDYGETLNSNTFTLPSTNFNVSGIITTSTDNDAFRFVLTQNSNFHLNATPYNIGPNDEGADLDIKVLLFNSSAILVRTYDPATTMNVVIDTILNTGIYYIKIAGADNPNVSNYGSLGSYTISGNTGALPIHDVSLNGFTEKDKHHLSWSIIADEPVKSIQVEVSADGSSFNPLTLVEGGARQFSYLPYQANTLYYRLKVTSVLEQSVYSNTIVLRGAGNTEKAFSVSTLVQTEISVNASANFQYRLSDINGRLIETGNGMKGISKIPVYKQADGIYIISLYSNNKVQSERIIKQ